MTSYIPVRRRRGPVRQPLRHPGGAEPGRSRTTGMPLDRRDAAGGRGPRAGGRPGPQPGHLRHHLDGAARRSGSSPRTCTATSSTTPSTRARPRSSSAASGCSPTSSTRPGETTGAPHPGLVRGDHARRAVPEVELAQAPRGRRRADRPSPNLVFGGDVHVVWEKFCRYFDVEPRIVPLQPRASTRSAPRTSSRTSTRTRSASPPCSARPSPATRTTSSASTTCCVGIKSERGLDVPLHVDGASGGFVWPFLYPDSEWDFRLEQVRSINVSGHKFGLVYPGIGWLIFREKSDLAEDLVFYENYLGKTDATFTLNFSTGSVDGARAVLQLRPLRARRLHLHHEERCSRTPASWPRSCEAMRPVRADRRRRGAAAAGRVPARRRARATTSSTSPGSSRPSAAGWCRPTRCRPNAQDVKIMRALVKETLSREQVDTLARDIEEACATLAQKGGAHRVRAGQDRHRARATDAWVACSRSSPGSSPGWPCSSSGSPGPARVDAAFDSWIWPLLGPDLPAVRDADLRHPLAGRRPERLGLVLGRPRRPVRHRPLGRGRGPAPASHHHGVGQPAGPDGRPVGGPSARPGLAGEPLAQPGEVGRWPSAPPGVSKTTGAPASRTTSARSAPSIWPAPKLACRSAPESNSSRLSLQCTRSIRPVIARTSSTTLPRSLPPAWAWQVSRQKPTVSPPSAPAIASQTPRDPVEVAGHRVVAAGGVLDQQRDLDVGGLDRLAPVVEARSSGSSSLLTWPPCTISALGADLGRGVACAAGAACGSGSGSGCWSVATLTM